MAAWVSCINVMQKLFYESCLRHGWLPVGIFNSHLIQALQLNAAATSSKRPFFLHRMVNLEKCEGGIALTEPNAG